MIYDTSIVILAVPKDITPDTQILSVTALDLLDYGVNADVRYSVVGGNGSALFEVSSNNGTVSAKSALEDRVRVGEYRAVNVEAKDLGSPSRSSVVTVTLLITSKNNYRPSVG